jgi:hypothetical protein
MSNTTKMLETLNFPTPYTQRQSPSQTPSHLSMFTFLLGLVPPRLQHYSYSIIPTHVEHTSFSFHSFRSSPIITKIGNLIEFNLSFIRVVIIHPILFGYPLLSTEEYSEVDRGRKEKRQRNIAETPGPAEVQ